MKNLIFLTGVIISVLILFGMRYPLNVINDYTFRVIIIIMFVLVLFIRYTLKISFFKS